MSVIKGRNLSAYLAFSCWGVGAAVSVPTFHGFMALLLLAALIWALRYVSKREGL